MNRRRHGQAPRGVHQIARLLAHDTRGIGLTSKRLLGDYAEVLVEVPVYDDCTARTTARLPLDRELFVYLMADEVVDGAFHIPASDARIACRGGRGRARWWGIACGGGRGRSRWWGIACGGASSRSRVAPTRRRSRSGPCEIAGRRLRRRVEPIAGGADPPAEPIGRERHPGMRTSGADRRSTGSVTDRFGAFLRGREFPYPPAEADRVEGRVQPGDAMHMESIAAFGTTLDVLVAKWQDAAREVGEADRHRTDVEADVTQNRLPRLSRVRKRWMDTIRAMRAAAVLLAPGDVEQIFRKLDESERRADARVAARRAAGAEPTPDVDEVLPLDGSDVRAGADEAADVPEVASPEAERPADPAAPEPGPLSPAVNLPNIPRSDRD